MVKASCKVWTVFILCIIAIASSAQTFTTLEVFNMRNGANPTSAPTQGIDGRLYGTTSGGGSPSWGVIFQLFGPIRSFDLTDGAFPAAALVQASDGKFYGTTTFGGVGGACGDFCGTVFKLTQEGKLTTLYSFCATQICTDGANPYGGLIQGADGYLYGMTTSGGNLSCNAPYGCGTVFKISLNGSFATIYTFNGPDGANPMYAGLVQATDGNFYGTTASGGDNNVGTVFRISASGQFTSLHSFSLCMSGCTEGELPYAGLIQGVDRQFYGTTVGGGICAFAGGCGTVYKITPRGKLTTLYSFCTQPDCADGAYPYAGLTFGNDGNLYGTTYSGGTCSNCNGAGGTIFRVTPEGSFSTLHSFDLTGETPIAGLFQATSGVFYGTTSEGGQLNKCSDHGCGTVYSLDIGLPAFVGFSPIGLGRVGLSARIIGQKLTGTTAVVFNGVPANFTVVSDTFIKATVPPGATTGYVTVTTSTGTLMSNVPFHVIP